MIVYLINVFIYFKWFKIKMFIYLLKYLLIFSII